METQGQYLNKKFLIENIGLHDITPKDLISADTYNESKMLEKYKKFSKSDQILLYKASIQLSIIGFGQKNYGSIRINDDEVMSLIDLFKKLNIKYNKNLSEKYEEDDFSARRLSRFFRYQIQEFILRSQRPSFLWLKYSEKDIKYISICFPGAEHLVENKDEMNYLLKTYSKLDSVLNTGFVLRLRRVFIARGLLNPLELEQNKQ